jgi:hypothetical protein
VFAILVLCAVSSAIASGGDGGELTQGMPFPAVRRLLLASQWQPVSVAQGADHAYLGVEHALIAARIREVESCAIDKAVCIFNYARGGRCLRLFTQGEAITDMRVSHWTDACPEAR